MTENAPGSEPTTNVPGPLSTTRFDRRRMLKLAGVGLAGGVAVAGQAGAQEGTLQSQLEEAASSTAQYADPEAAIENGFAVLGPYVPDMGWHFLNADRIGTLDRTQPQLLTYDDEGGNLSLASVEYAIPVGTDGFDEENPPDLFDDSGDDPAEEWHVHPQAEHVFAVPPPEAGEGAEAGPAGETPGPSDGTSLTPTHRGSTATSSGGTGTPSGGPSLDDQLHTTNWIEIVPGGEPGDPMFPPGVTILTNFASGGPLEPRTVVSSEAHPALLTLHLWVHQQNPAGAFAETNPTLANSPRP